jgi:two-component system, cell cycle sensor histidine kinase and response regulator CckA
MDGRSRKVTLWAAGVAVTLSLVVIFGWLAGIHSLTGYSTGLHSMKFNTSIAMLGLGLSLAVGAVWPRWRVVGISGSLLPVVLGVAAVSAWSGGPGVALDQLLVRDPGEGVAPGRISPLTSLNVTLLGLSLVAFHVLGRRTSVVRLVSTVALVSLVIAVAAGVGLVFDGELLHAPLRLRGMGPITALTTSVVAIGMLTLANTRAAQLVLSGEGPAGSLLRRTLPITLSVVAVISYLRLIAQQAGLLDVGSGVAINLVATALVFTLLQVIAALRIDRQHQDLEEQRVTAQLYQDVLDQSPSAVFVKEPDGRYLIVNRATSRTLGIDRDRMIGRTDFDLLPEGVAERFGADDERVLQRGEALELEEIVPTPEGDRTMQTSKFPIEVEGRPMLIGGISTDITVRLVIEQRAAQAERLETVGRLAGGIAHDFNNLLTVMSGMSLLASHQDDIHAARPYLQQVIDAASRAGELSHELLTFARHEATVVEGTCCPNDVVSELHRLLSPLLGADVSLEISLDDGAGMVAMNATRLEQVVMNLAVNARDSMPDGGRLTIETSAVEVSEEEAAGLAPLQPGRHSEILVSDTGTGMSAEVRARAFEPFYTTKSHGSGLGLASVYGIVTAAGGTIDLRSAPGQGTRLRVLLPVVNAPQPEDSGTEPAPEPVTMTGTALMIDDEPMVRMITRFLLEEMGFEVLEAGSAERVRELAETIERPTMVLSDVVLTDGYGPEVVSELYERWPGMPVLYVSGYTDRAGRWLRPGDRVLHKPFSDVAFQQAVIGALRDAEQDATLGVDQDTVIELPSPYPSLEGGR